VRASVILSEAKDPLGGPIARDCLWRIVRLYTGPCEPPVQRVLRFAQDDKL